VPPAWNLDDFFDGLGTFLRIGAILLAAGITLALICIAPLPAIACILLCILLFK
jgi:hypothetical protein